MEDLMGDLIGSQARDRMDIESNADQMMIESMEIAQLRKNKRIKKKKEKNLYSKQYNEHTMVMRAYRKTKCCVVCYRTYNTPDSPKYLFQYEYMWDPYTGEQLEKDPYGPLVYCPECISQSIFYRKNTAELYIPPHGEFQERYGDALGAGHDFSNVERGNDHPEWNIFRINIPTMYLEPDADLSLITMGPVLTDDDVRQIDEHLHQQNPSLKFSLVQMKKLYDTAVSKFTIPIQFQGHADHTEQHQKEYIAKTHAAKTLYKMKWA